MNPYIEQKILTADPIELIRILYQHGILSIREAREHLRAGRIMERVKCVNRAWAVLVELNISLRPEAAPEVARQLSDLYCYMMRRLTTANFEQKDEPLAEVLGLMTTLSEAWTAAPAPEQIPQSGFAWQAAMASGAQSSGIEICG
jgi:flagellar secretion chaperone FliS